MDRANNMDYAPHYLKLKDLLRKAHDMLEEENITPVGFIEDGRKEEVEIDGGDVWSQKGYLSSSF